MNILVSCRHTIQDNGTHRYFSNVSYITALEKVGLHATIACPNQTHDYTFLAQCFDGLLLSGGNDVDATYYHEENHSASEVITPNIDEMDLALIKAFHQVGKPILGICRGLQIINVYFSGTLHQHLPEYSSQNHNQSQPRNETSHVVRLINKLVWSRDELNVNSFHHQGIKVLANELNPLAIAEDGLIEAFYYDNIIAVQWHPEELSDQADHLILFEYFKSLIEKNKALKL